MPLMATAAASIGFVAEGVSTGIDPLLSLSFMGIIRSRAWLCSRIYHFQSHGRGVFSLLHATDFCLAFRWMVLNVRTWCSAYSSYVYTPSAHLSCRRGAVGTTCGFLRSPGVCLFVYEVKLSVRWVFFCVS